MAGWMNCDLKSFSTIFLSYRDDGRVIMKGSMYANKDKGIDQELIQANPMSHP